jgi:hypothetical protein
LFFILVLFLFFVLLCFVLFCFLQGIHIRILSHTHTHTNQMIVHLNKGEFFFTNFTMLKVTYKLGIVCVDKHCLNFFP